MESDDASAPRATVFCTIATDGTNVSIEGANSTNALYSAQSTTEDPVVVVDSADNVGVGILTPTQKLDVSGNIRLRSGLYDGNNILGSSGSVLTTTGSQVAWVTSSSVVAGSGQASPIGSVIWYAGTGAPTNYLVCDGTSYSSSNPAFNPLFLIIGTTYNNVGDAAGTFRVPDLRDSFASGNGTNGAVGARGGSNSVTLTTNQIPAHTHAITDPNHYHGLSGATPYRTGSNTGQGLTNAGQMSPTMTQTNGAQYYPFGSVGTGVTVGNNVTTGVAHENRPQYLVLLPCIKYQ
jgi:microcystin-dependent protein